MKYRLLAALATAIVVLAIVLVSPRRHVSGDVVPGRYGAFVLQCGGGFDLRHLAWIDALDREGRLPYWAQLDRDRRIVSTFGPGPAVAGAIAMAGAGDAATDDTLRVRERIAAGTLLGIATALLVLAIAARRSLRTSVAFGAIGALSYAGAATLGQGLWQQTVALPFLVGALAALAWNRPRVTPALLVVAVLLRPAITPLALGLGIVWVLRRPARRDVVIAAAIVAIAALPLVAWNFVHLGSPLPLGQATANAALADDMFVFSRAHVGTAIGGLLVSPARGLVWFAPIAVLAIVCAFRGKQREHVVIAAALCVQLVAMALFYRWWGGVTYGPRLLAELAWVAVWLAAQLELRRVLLAVAAGVTIVVGQLGLWGWRAEQWETRRMVDIDTNALWDVVDSPIPSMLRGVDDQLLALDAPGAPPIARCD